MMKRMIAGANIQTNKKLSNHSARKFLIQKLNDNNVPPNRIMQISGHKNVNSINNYSHINRTQHKDISRILHSILNINTADLQASSSKSIQAASTANVSIHGGIQTLFAGLFMEQTSTYMFTRILRIIHQIVDHVNVFVSLIAI